MPLIEGSGEGCATLSLRCALEAAWERPDCLNFERVNWLLAVIGKSLSGPPTASHFLAQNKSACESR